MNTNSASALFAARRAVREANAALKIAAAAAYSAREKSWAADAVLRIADANYLTAEAILIRAERDRLLDE